MDASTGKTYYNAAKSRALSTNDNENQVSSLARVQCAPRKSFVDRGCWASLPGYTLVFLLLVYPLIAPLLYVKAGLLACVLATVGAYMLKTGRSGLHPSIARWTFALSAMGLFFIMEGFFAGAPGASKSVGVYVVWPVLYVLMIAGIRSERILRGIVCTSMISTISISIFSIVYMLINIQILPESKYYDLISFNWDKQIFALHDGYISMQYPGINSLPFLVPFLIAALVTCVGRIPRESLLRRLWPWTVVLAGLESVLVSGRRALILVTVIAPFLTLLFLCFQPVAQRCLSWKSLVRVVTTGTLAVAVSLVCLNVVSGINLSGLYERFSVGFDFSPTTQDNGANERREQFHALLEGWMDNPVLGVGHGVPAYGSIRSELQPWSYELKYMALLYQTGIVGFTAYAAGIVWIYWMGLRVIRSGGYLSALMVACLTGMSSILIAGATNPYLDNFDGMWTIFFPLAVINVSLLRSHAPLPSAGGQLRDSSTLGGQS